MVCPFKQRILILKLQGSRRKVPLCKLEGKSKASRPLQHRSQKDKDSQL